MKEGRAEGAWVGRALPRREDLRFVTGRGEYVDDRLFPNALHVVPVRSIYAHATIRRIDTSEASRVQGVAAVLTADDLAPHVRALKAALPGRGHDIESFPLARGKVRYFGEPVAVVVADSPEAAEDAAQLVQIDYEPLEPVLDPERAVDAGSPLVHDNVATNLAWHKTFSYGNVERAFAGAARVVRRRLHLHRFTSAPLETRQAVVSMNPRTGVFHVFSNVQSPERFRARIAAALDIPQQALHFECPDIGGAFGNKLHVLWVILLAVVARRFGRPAKWVEDRTGQLSASHHGNEVLYDAEIALRADGVICGLRAKAIHDEGAYLEREPKGAVNQLRHATVLYRFRDLEMEFLAVMTNKCPTGPNRAYGKVQQVFLVERMIDEAARELGIDALELRRRNLVAPEDMPYETPTGALYDGGDYPKLFERIAAAVDFPAFRKRQAAALREGRYLGLGFAAGIEASPSSASLQQLIDPGDSRSGDSEAALVRLGADGRVFAACGSVPQGQGHETAISQIVADALGTTPGYIDVTTGFDSLRDPSTPNSGTHASRFTVMGGGAVAGACALLRERVIAIAAHLLGVPKRDIRLSSDAAIAPDERGITFGELARIAHEDLARLPPGAQPGLDARYVYHAPLGRAKDGSSGNFSLTYAYGASVVEVSVDPDTGRVVPERIVCIHDCGVQINPLIVEGQVHGAIAHQLGAALFERIEYDEQGQLTTSTFKNYLTPTAMDLPRYECGHIVTPSLFAPLGARGSGEGSGTPLVAAINAVADALAPLGVTLVEGHVSPKDVWTLVRQARTRLAEERPAA